MKVLATDKVARTFPLSHSIRGSSARADPCSYRETTSSPPGADTALLLRHPDDF